MYILGLSCFYHDSAAALIKDGHIVAAAQEERFTRKKHDASFPKQATEYCLKEAGISITDVDSIVYYEKPFLTFERLLETYISQSPRGFTSFIKAMPLWLKQKLGIRSIIRHELRTFFEVKKSDLPQILFSAHHLSHAASAFFASPYEDAAVLCLDGVGEWATTTLWHGHDNTLKPLGELHFPHSLGLLYSAFTYFCGFKVNSGEYKLMGLAPYGKPRFTDVIKQNLIDIKDDGSFRLDLSYFDYIVGLKMTNSKFSKLFGVPARKPETDLGQVYMDLAASIQVVTEEVILKLAKTAKEKTRSKSLCLAGGVALNCVANGRLLRSEIFDSIWVQPAAGDAGGALGASLAYWHLGLNKPRVELAGDKDLMQNAYLGPEFGNSAIEPVLKQHNLKYRSLESAKLPSTIAELLEKQQVIGWFQGRMEYGPRALGARSIMADARPQQMQHTVNRKVKFRESFRPLAPVITIDRAAEFFDGCESSPYMILTFPVSRAQLKNTETEATGLELLIVDRSNLGSITLVNGSARVQTIDKSDNTLYHETLSEFEKLTGYPVTINTSFNVRGEPIVCTPEDAVRCFLATDIDFLVIGNFLVEKLDSQRIELEDQPNHHFPLD
ncbi:MAG: carbamoyltransferase [Bdellovibrionales bacterium]|nr:carbamoyltransferase [Bdellovibrionales bacterium]